MRASVAARGRCTLALAGSSTPRDLYLLLGEHPELPWADTLLCFGDERGVPPSHRDSNARMVHEALTHHAFIPAAEGRAPPPGQRVFSDKRIVVFCRANASLHVC
jgi:6-phosphogluconolactonase